MKASKLIKKQILDEFCSICGYNRKYATRLLNSSVTIKSVNNLSRRGRKKVYDDPLIMEVIRDIWIVTNLPCSKNLKEIIRLWLPFYNKHRLTDAIEQKLFSISPATIDRLMAPSRSKFNKMGLSTTKPGSILKKHIPVKTNQWDESMPGFLEADAIAHCGSSVAGMFVYTINCVDIATQWTEQRAVWGKGERGVKNSIQDIESHLPFPLKGFDCDNGSEFLNWHLVRYLTKYRKKPVQFTRSRAYQKNDNAHIENKNWTHVRQYLGYQRFDKPQLVDMLNDLYTSEWNLYFNFFIPSVKLIFKERVRSKIIKKYDKPKTPYQRLMESESIDQTTKNRLKEQFESLNPFELQKRMKSKINAIINLVNENRCDELSTYPQQFTKEERKKRTKKRKKKINYY
jgi:hypothetical protein